MVCSFSAFFWEMAAILKKCGLNEYDPYFQVFTAKPLVAGSRYVFRVAGQNRIGVGEFSQSTIPATINFPHGKGDQYFQN